MFRTLSSATTTLTGKEVTLKGWVNTRRDHGKIVFIDLRDRSGIVQTVGDKKNEALSSFLSQVRGEDVVEISGIVKSRPESMVNPKMATGTVEVEITQAQILGKSHELPLPIDTDGYAIAEDVRLKYRYLDLRRERLQKNIRLRSKMVDLIRQFLFKEEFTEIETPLLTKSTPEGSRDFLVPSRLQPGNFYALPQSPQQYKQLLMVAGFERYFQIARCLRDEDLRADRGFEHSQVDLEMSFVTREEVMAIDEAMLISVVEALGYTIKQKPFPIFTYKEAMEQFGADKFDLRTEEDKKNGIMAFAWVIDFPFFEKTEEGGWTFTHNPFSNPRPEHKQWLLNKEHISEIVTDQYDIVCNGYEVGGGSIRSHEPDILMAVFEVMGYTKERIYEQFGHMLEAFTYGAPPHGGLAHGIERLLMTITQEPYLREVVAFPQTNGGLTSVMSAPSPVTKDQLEELGIAVATVKQKPVFERIIEDLTKKKIEFAVTEHEAVKTSEEAAAIRGVSLSTGAKALVLYADDKPIMVVVAGNRKIDMKVFKTLYGVKDLRMATPEEVKTVTTVEIGAVPPFGHLFQIPLYLDSSLRSEPTIFFNPGLHTKTIGMKEADYEKAAVAIVGEFSKE
jgi:aspartyl-tRNA synthetase